MDEDDPAFLGLVQSSGPRTSNTDEGVEESDDGLALGTESDTDGAALDGDGAGTVEGDTDMQSDDVWIACVYEEVNVALGGSSSMGNMRVIATASACVAAHRVQCSYFCGEHACDQLLDHLSILQVNEVAHRINVDFKTNYLCVVTFCFNYVLLSQPKEVIYSDNLSQSVRDALLRVCLNSSGGAAQDQSRYILRLASAPTLQFLTNNVEEQSDAAVGAVYRSEATNWISTRLPFLECKYAVFGLQHYLAELKLESVLYEPRLEVHLPRQDAPARREVSLPSTASSEASGFRLDAVTARDLEVFESSMTGKPLFTSNLAHKFADLVEQQQRKSTASAPAFVSAGGGGKGPLSLFSVINYCRTPFGRRTLRHWLLHPLCSAQAIEARQQAAQWLAGNAHAPSSSAGSASVSAGRHSKSASCWVSKAAGLLASSGDVEKVVGALQHQRILPRGMLKLFDFAVALCEFHRDCMVGLQRESNIPDLIFSAFDLAHCPELAHRVENLRSKLNAAAAGEDAVTDVFTPTAVQDFPQLREFQQEAVATEEALAAELVNIRVLLKMPNLNFKSLRTGPVSKIEHLIEVPVQMSTRVPKEFIRSNCTKQVERYHSPVVLALQDRLYLLRDEIKRAARAAWGEYVLQVRGLVCTPLRAAVEALGEIDALLSLAKLSCIPGYVQPTFGSGDDDGDVLEIIAGRHPMVEKYLERECAQFIPNDVQLRRNFRARSTQVVTGPNMGGKSSYVRMVALICLMAQIGACVPAESAKLCIFDRIFTRMGAGDDLAAGHSTFMSELHRTNYILQRASSRSLVILDELGRGTATNDGLAIAQATLKYVLRRLGSAVLFVTHFPQIADLVEQSNLPATVAPIAESPAESKNCDVGDEQENVTFPHYQAVNIHMGYLEESDRSNVTFLYKVVSNHLI